MTFPELLAEILKLKPAEKRAQEEDYLEVVVSVDSLGPFHKTLAAYFGQPLKPEGQSPSEEASKRAAAYGGIRNNQTMYFRQDATHSECALLWPWGNGTQVTVKVLQDKISG